MNSELILTLQPSGKQITATGNETILNAALRQQVVLPYGCKNGACGACKSKITEGDYTQGEHSANALTSAEKNQGYALLCCTTAQSALTIECRELQGVGDIPIRKLPCRVASLEKVIDDVMIIKLQLPANEKLQFLPGQYIDMLLRDGSRRSYSIANIPEASDQLELHIRHMPGGVFTDQVFSTLKEKDLLRFEGPMGSFFLRKDSDKPIIMLASGTGFAPIKALIEQIRHHGIERSVHLYWGSRKRKDIYHHEFAMQWAKELPNLDYVPVLSEDSDWSGRKGFVHQAVLEDFSDLSGHEVYACGAPAMVAAAKQDFIAKANLPEAAFFADAFTSLADNS
jgi:CDP-4-dehydro-6-deoxyglucose reductase, E3